MKWSNTQDTGNNTEIGQEEDYREAALLGITVFLGGTSRQCARKPLSLMLESLINTILILFDEDMYLFRGLQQIFPNEGDVEKGPSKISTKSTVQNLVISTLWRRR